MPAGGTADHIDTWFHLPGGHGLVRGGADRHEALLTALRESLERPATAPSGAVSGSSREN